MNNKIQFFLIRGFPRSGTNWINNILNLHPRVFAMGELGFTKLKMALNEINNRMSIIRSKITLKQNINNKFDSFVRESILCFLDFTDKKDIQWIGERSPDSLSPEIIPGAKTFYIIRDGRDCIVSWAYHCLRTKNFNSKNPEVLSDMTDKADILSDNPEYFIKNPHKLLDNKLWVKEQARRWAGRLINNMRSLSLETIDGREVCGNVMIVKYENLHKDIESERKRIYRFLDLDYKIAEEIDGLTSPGFGKENPLEHNRLGSVGDWKRYFSKDTARWFSEETSVVLIRLGYEKDDSWV